ncbi:MAG TPA: hypothetical protein PKN99_03805 [Cyclobacteriaceae bacterium]|nr:hypothetical protein [Cyclobacteriaceae bacterium]
METKEEERMLQKPNKVFDHLDKMPDISLMELYYVLKASRKRLKEKYIQDNKDLGLSSSL